MLPVAHLGLARVGQCSPAFEPFASGLLTVTDGNSISWECCGNPAGKPFLHVHGGPGAGMRADYRRRFNPDRHLIVGFEQRGCGRSRPLAIEDLATLASNTTQNLVSDIEALREHLGIDRWLLAGVSWRTTLAWAYAQAHPDRVSEMVLLATTLTDASAVEWITETVGCLFPVEWEQFRAAANPRPGQHLVDAYYELLTHPDPKVRQRAAIAWEHWENAHLPGSAPAAQYPIDRLNPATGVRHPRHALLEARRLPARGHAPGRDKPTPRHPRSAHSRQTRRQRPRRHGLVPLLLNPAHRGDSGLTLTLTLGRRS